MLNKGNVQKKIYSVLYVEDLVVACGDKEILDSFKTSLMSTLKIKEELK